MGKLDHETLDSRRAGEAEAPLFESLKQVWLSSLQLPDDLAPDRRNTHSDLISDRIIVSEPPPARVLP